jgi:hypothetical protein
MRSSHASSAVLPAASNPRRLALLTVSADVAHLLYATAFCTAVLFAFIAVTPDMRHWFVVPVLICGVLIGTDAMGLVTGTRDIFDPIGIIGLLGLHFFFLAPLLHVYWGYWIDDVKGPADWRVWLGLMAVLNAAGLLLYRWARTETRRRTRPAPVPQRRWGICRARFGVFLGFLLVVTLMLQLWIYSMYGGIAGYIDMASEGGEAFRNMGVLFLVSESFPALALIGFVIYGADSRRTRSLLVVLGVMLLFLALRFFFGGLRGSRSTIAWSMFWAVGVMHLWLRALPRRVLLAGIAFLIVFMYFYGLYKGSGRGVIDILQGRAVITELEERARRPIESTLLGDLARSDVQALLLYRSVAPSDAEFAWGRTYFGAAALLVPRFVWPDRPAGKIEVGTDFQYGSGSYALGRFESLRVYGLAGEALINFGPLAVPLSYVVLGWLVRRVRRFASELHEKDTRVLLLPLLVSLCVTMVVSDADNLLFLVAQNGMMPFLLLLSGRRMVVVTRP